MCLKHSWSNFDPQAHYLYGEDQNCETSFKDKGLQTALDSWCKIQVVSERFMGVKLGEMKGDQATYCFLSRNGFRMSNWKKRGHTNYCIISYILIFFLDKHNILEY